MVLDLVRWEELVKTARRAKMLSPAIASIKLMTHEQADEILEVEEQRQDALRKKRLVNTMNRPAPVVRNKAKKKRRKTKR